MEATPPPWTDLILGPLGLLVGCLVAVWAFATGRIIRRSEYDAMVTDRDRWQRECLALLSVGETAMKVAKEKV